MMLCVFSHFFHNFLSKKLPDNLGNKWKVSKSSVQFIVHYPSYSCNSMYSTTYYLHRKLCFFGYFLSSFLNGRCSNAHSVHMLNSMYIVPFKSNEELRENILLDVHCIPYSTLRRCNLYVFIPAYKNLTR